MFNGVPVPPEMESFKSKNAPGSALIVYASILNLTRRGVFLEADSGNYTCTARATSTGTQASVSVVFTVFGR